MELAVDSFTILVDQFERVGAVPVHVGVAVWDPTIGEQERDLVSGLGTQRDEVPKHVCILEYINSTKSHCHIINTRRRTRKVSIV